jgi:nucleotide-binding universal stress UspA family protein
VHGENLQVVAGIDLSSMGRRVADRARIVAEAFELPLHLVHVLESVDEAMIERSHARLMRDHQHLEASKLRDWTAERSAVPVELEVVTGSPSWTLAHRAKTARMLVVGSSSIDNFSVGPVALRLAQMARADTLVVRRQPRVPYRKIIAAIDFSEQSRAAVRHALEQFPKAEVTALYSLPARFDPLLVDSGLFVEEVSVSRAQRLARAGERMAEFTRPWAGEVKSLVVDGPPISTIDETLRRRWADLVVVGARGATATRMVLLGTVAEGLVRSAPCDVLVARTPLQFRRP